MKREDQDSPDPVARSIDTANEMPGQPVATPESVSRLVEVLESLPPRELVRRSRAPPPDPPVLTRCPD